MNKTACCILSNLCCKKTMGYKLIQPAKCVHKVIVINCIIMDIWYKPFSFLSTFLKFHEASVRFYFCFAFRTFVSFSTHLNMRRVLNWSDFSCRQLQKNQQNVCTYTTVPWTWYCLFIYFYVYFFFAADSFFIFSSRKPLTQRPTMLGLMKNPNT